MTLTKYACSLLVTATALITLPACSSASAKETSSEELVTLAVTQAFVDQDPTAVDRYWSAQYIQHNPLAPNGPAPLRGFLEQLPPTFKYEMGLVIAQGDLVMVQGRASGLGEKATISVDIYRVEGGKIAEHWDVLQEEVPADQTASGNPMFTPRASD